MATRKTSTISLTKNKNNWGTVEQKHKEQLKIFEDEKESVESLKNKQAELQKKLEKAKEEIKNNENTKNEHTKIIENIKNMENELKKLKLQIHNIEHNVNEYKYLIETGPILIKYYDSINNPDVIPRKQSMCLHVNSKMNSNANSSTNSNAEPITNTIGSNKNLIKNNTTNTKSRFDLLDEYNSKTDPNWVKKTKTESKTNNSICEKCGILMNLNYRESTYVCSNCATEITVFLDNDRLSYKDPPPEVNYFAYKRINHFNELLAQFQAKESTNIPQEVLDTILMELKKGRKSVRHLDYILVKNYLKKHSDKKYNQYYDHIFHIINRLNGDKPLNMTPEMEEKLRSLFLQIQEPFVRYCPPNRKNFISYNFVFSKFCKMLGYTEYLKYFPLLKSKEKLYDQEKIWEKICTDIGLPNVIY